MNEVSKPWGVSPFDVQARLMRIPQRHRSTLRVRDDTLEALSSETADRARDDLREYAGLQGRINAPWAGAAIRSREEAELASDMAHNLSSVLLPAGLDRLNGICRELGVPQPASSAAWADLYALLDGVSRMWRLLGDDVFGTDVAALATATARRAERRARGGTALGWSARRALRKQARARSDLSRVVTEFQRYDAEHLARNADRVRRIAAQQARDAQDAHQDQASLVRREAGMARKHMPLRDLLDRAPDVMLALKPCWATSPIVVSQVLPPSRLFDVVIFDEASQVKQADAISPIMRPPRSPPGIRGNSRQPISSAQPPTTRTRTRRRRRR